MTKVVGVSNTTVRMFDGHDTQGHTQYIDLVVTAIAYDDGRVIQQNGDGRDWVQIKDPDNNTGIVGKCKDCGEPVYEDDLYNFSKKENWVAHAAEEDCVKKKVDDEA